MTGAGQATDAQAGGQRDFEAVRQELINHVPRHVPISEIHLQIHGRSTVGPLQQPAGAAHHARRGDHVGSVRIRLHRAGLVAGGADAFSRATRPSRIQWLSKSFLQLVLLPIIIVGQNVISAAQDARAEADHATLTRAAPDQRPAVEAARAAAADPRPTRGDARVLVERQRDDAQRRRSAARGR